MTSFEPRSDTEIDADLAKGLPEPCECGNEHVAVYRLAKDVVPLRARVSELTAENERLQQRIRDAHAVISEAQRLAWDQLQFSGATRIEHEERSVEQVNLVSLYSCIHDGVKRLAGRGDLELPPLDEAKVLVLEYRQAIAVERARVAQLEQALTAEVDSMTTNEVLLRRVTRVEAERDVERARREAVEALCDLTIRTWGADGPPIVTVREVRAAIAGQVSTRVAAALAAVPLEAPKEPKEGDKG